MDHKYKVLYKIKVKPEGFTKSEIPPGGEYGATDALYLVSLIRSPSGSVSQMICSYDGENENGQLDAGEEFMIWSIMAQKLSERDELGAGRKELCRQVFELIKEAVIGSKTN